MNRDPWGQQPSLLDFPQDEWLESGEHGIPHTIHPQVRLFMDGRIVLVDVELAPLLVLIWSAGISTFVSCQGSRRTLDGHIGFTTMDDAARFLLLMGDIPGRLSGSGFFDFTWPEGQKVVFEGTRRLVGVTPTTRRPKQMHFRLS